MILNVSGRTDIVAFYTEWFMNRYKEGFVDVRNPFNPKLISRINFSNVDAILFCTKNPKPIIKYLKEIEKPILFHVTLTPYNKDIEPNVSNKKEIIESIKELSSILGIDNLYIRYDPIFISEKYNIEYHLKAFNKMCTLLDGYVKQIIVSFIDNYKNVKRNERYLKFRDFTEDDYKIIGEKFSQIAKQHNMTIQTCFEDRNLSEYGFKIGECFSHQLSFKLTGKTYKNWKARKCNCVQMVDIGYYNSCKHFCKYCYANYDEKIVNKNCSKHNPKSSLLIGEIESDDIIKERIT
jgi:DNA repair photolyase